ncbi:casein kinase substrate phosphoprotein PP28-domain-containing protein [Mycena floridula]|nr:casein kinase substrate phosphoprotein PP28-domain-containing protein [Mycena floridula]
MVRGTGKFKQKRGGGRSFSKNLVLDENGTAVSTDKKWARRGEEASDEESSEEEEEDEEEESSEEEAPDASSSQPEMTRAERRELKKKQGAKEKINEEEEDEDLINPNRTVKKMNISDLSAPRELSRREREQKEKADAKERYWKLHVAGKTDEAKADLGRLAKIRAEREAAQAKRKAEADAKAAEAEAKASAQKAAQAKRS